jgi:GntP family gluconate:H+ symporter
MYPFVILASGMAVVIGGILLLRLHAFLALLLGALTVAILTPDAALKQYAADRNLSPAATAQLLEESIGERVANGFGRTSAQVAIVIAMASIIGICLLESGAADRLVRSALKLVGPSRAPVAFTATGFLLAIPVFFDTVFYLMIPLAKATRLRTGKNYLFYILAIVAGGTMAHSLVPPTPGPLFVAGEFGVDLGTMIIGGILVGLLASTAGFLFARFANLRKDLPLRDSEESLKELKKISEKADQELPSVMLSMLPILLPVLLITSRTLAESLGMGERRGPILDFLLFLGDKNIALTLAALIAILTLFWKTSGAQTTAGIRKSLTTAGVIILIIGAGGAFGSALQQTGIGASIRQLTTAYQVSVLLLAFALTTLVRTAQGSATVAMITSAGALTALANPALLGFHPVYLALAIGCGSKPVWWMNDSGFWVVSEMSGMTAKEGLTNLTPLSAIMGVVGLLATMLGAYLFPLV